MSKERINFEKMRQDKRTLPQYLPLILLCILLIVLIVYNFTINKKLWAIEDKLAEINYFQITINESLDTAEKKVVSISNLKLLKYTNYSIFPVYDTSTQTWD